MQEVSTPTRNYRGRTLADRRAERRSQFIWAALEVFSAKGYASSSVADICADAGLARRQFYDEFDSREDLLIALYDQIQNDARDAITGAIAHRTPPSLGELAEIAMRAYVESIGGDPRRAQISHVDVIGVSSRVEAHRVERRTEWAVFFKAAVQGAAGEDFVPPGGYEMAATAFVGALTALVHQWSTAPTRQPVDGLIEVMSTILSGLLGAEKAAD